MGRGDNPLRVQDVSVIIVNYNGESVLDRSLNSVLSLDPRPLECILVDNGSTDKSLDVAQKFHDPLLRILSLSENYGVAGGRNRGVAVAKGQVYAFLDSDGQATLSWLPAGVAVLAQNPAAGAIAPLVLMGSGDIINGAGSFLDAWGHGRDRLRGEPLDMHEGCVRAWRGQPVDYPMGCGMIIRRKGLESIWPLDESMPKWHDDTEIGIRIRRLGYQVPFEPSSLVLHYPGHSDPREGRKRHQLAEMARLLLLWKYYPFLSALGSTVHYSFFALSGSRRDPSYRQELWAAWTMLLKNRRKIRMIRHQWRKTMPLRHQSFHTR